MNESIWVKIPLECPYCNRLHSFNVELGLETKGSISEAPKNRLNCPECEESFGFACVLPNTETARIYHNRP